LLLIYRTRDLLARIPVKKPVKRLKSMSKKKTLNSLKSSLKKSNIQQLTTKVISISDKEEEESKEDY
jgi:hypothetical protein